MAGPRCEFGATTINLTAELGPSVTMVARVTNREFSEDMADASSPGHRRFAEEFGRTMDGVYRNVAGYRGINVLSLSRGSVVVNYRVRLHPLPGNASLERRALELLALANAASRPHDLRPLGELCRRHARANFSRFYFPYRTAHGLLCVTNCTLNVPGSFDCRRGLCQLTVEGPQCFAAAEDAWPDGGRNSRVTGIYHVNGRGGGKGAYGHNTYKPSSEVAEPPAPVGDGETSFGGGLRMTWNPNFDPKL
ncbi:hypothetical protein DUI87_00411 [Hirundo rustica rustica]|uniref:SEA domain-containing protein n=1 Tax=Hirundo rustica rustica TaxID=333673 RepID=A0A3M0LBF3_HIRRU|nr:hypothetical protein DUI87_00411 [Hirundo rustica rustica]